MLKPLSHPGTNRFTASFSMNLEVPSPTVHLNCETVATLPQQELDTRRMLQTQNVASWQYSTRCWCMIKLIPLPLQFSIVEKIRSVRHSNEDPPPKVLSND